MGQNEETGMERSMINKINDNRLAKIARNGKPNMLKAPIPWRRKLDINITGEQAHWIKYRT